MMISPAYAYEKAPDQEHFLGVERDARAVPEAFADGNRKRWRLNHTPLFLDFLEGKVDFQCTPWGIPSYSLFGWQRPCYLMSDGYAETYQELLETTDWSKYGRGNDPRCENCMAHCGYEPTAVLADDALAAGVAARVRISRLEPPAPEHRSSHFRTPRACHGGTRPYATTPFVESWHLWKPGSDPWFLRGAGFYRPVGTLEHLGDAGGGARRAVGLDRAVVDPASDLGRDASAMSPGSVAA